MNTWIFAGGFLGGFLVADLLWRGLTYMAMQLAREQRTLIAEQGELIDAMRNELGIEA